MYSINTYTKKKYITPIIEFEMMEEEVSVMAGSPNTVEEQNPPGEGTNDPETIEGLGNPAKGFQSDFIFDENVEF